VGSPNEGDRLGKKDGSVDGLVEGCMEGKELGSTGGITDGDTLGVIETKASQPLLNPPTDVPSVGSMASIHILS